MGITMNLSYGLVLFIGGIALLISNYYQSLDWIGFSLAFVMIIIGFITLVLAISESRIRTLEIDDLGLRFRIGKKIKWTILWGEFREIGTSSLGGRYPRQGFYIKTDNGTYQINNRDDFGPKKQLIEIYRIIVRKGSGPMVASRDWLGWNTVHGMATEEVK